jgi:hypothetical protein
MTPECQFFAALGTVTSPLGGEYLAIEAGKNKEDER